MSESPAVEVVDPLSEDLAKELAGLPGSPTASAPDAAAMPGALPAPGGAAHVDPLDFTPKPAPAPAVARANMKAGGKGFRVVVGGDYYRPAREGKGKIAEQYKLAFNVAKLDDTTLGKIVKFLLLAALKKHYPGAIGYRTHQLLEATPLSPETRMPMSLRFANRAQLVNFIEENSAPIDPKLYPEEVELREAVIDWKLNPKGFEKREAAKLQEREMKAELLGLNPDLAEKAADVATVQA